MLNHDAIFNDGDLCAICDLANKHFAINIFTSG
jgi:hypothetical protein